MGNAQTCAVEHYPFHWIIKKFHPIWRWPAQFCKKKCQCNYPKWTKEKKLSHATSVGNKRKQTEDRKTFFISNIVSILSSPSKKADQNKVHGIKDLLQCSMSSAYHWKKRLLNNVDIWFIKSTIQRWNGLSNHALFKKKLSGHWDRN